MTPEPNDLTCEDPQRRQALLASDLDGIDYVEVPFDDQRHVRVYLVKGPPPALEVDQVTVEGGVRITGIEVVAVDTATDADGVAHVRVSVDQAGDFSPYLLRIDAPGVLDPVYDHKAFGFKVGCPTDLDCLEEPECPPGEAGTPVIDYLAKDYASFRQLLVDLVPAKVPDWTDRHEADLAMTLVELLAYEGDQISYAQDAVAQEMHLETARQRESVARHVRLIDYPMHHGINAKVFVHVTVGETGGAIPARSLRCPERTVRFLTRIGTPVDPTSALPPGVTIAREHEARALAAADAVFEPVEAARLEPSCNRIHIHTWGDAGCCLPAGSTSVDLVGRVPLQAGDLLLLEEVRGVTTGLPQDADPGHRQVVRIVGVDPPGLPAEDPLYTLDPDAEGGVGPRGDGDDPLPVTHVRWDPQDALTFPLCVSTTDPAGEPMAAVAVARGNIVLVDHGATVREEHVPDETRTRYSRIGYRYRLSAAPLTFGFGRDFTSGGPVAALLRLDPRQAEPHVVLVDGDGAGFTWLPEPELLSADAFSRSFVAEPDHAGHAQLRFGDGTFGRQPSFPEQPSQAEETRIHAIYRVGNGRQGNVGVDTIAHLLEPADPAAAVGEIVAVRNPLAAWGGVDPEPIELVKQLAPDAFRAETYRAVTEDDYARAAQLLPTVSRSQADFRWTGSWHTVFATVDPVGTDVLDLQTETAVRTQLTRYKLAGYDLEIDPPRYVALRIGLVVCAAPDHFRADVGAAVRRALSAATLPGGAHGFFHPDNFTFGQPLHLSRVYAAVEAVPGVDSVEVVRFHRLDERPAGELRSGRIDAGRLEVLRLDNDPNFPEHGVLTVELEGGK
ncbi:MAG TPA: putative baseplate assembly protein [Actinomycetota bacterium]|nr:putative baseplate assembly protein [Actinomycetota bacterium]